MTKFAVTRSKFRNVAEAMPVVGVENSIAAVTHNSFENVTWGPSFYNSRNTLWIVSDNEIDTVFGVYAGNIADHPINPPEGLDTSAIPVKNNRFHGANGPFFEAEFGPQMLGLLVNNDVSDVSDIGIFLGPGTRNCIVIGTPAADVVNQGTNNHIIPGRGPHWH